MERFVRLNFPDEETPEVVVLDHLPISVSAVLAINSNSESRGAVTHQVTKTYVLASYSHSSVWRRCSLTGLRFSSLMILCLLKSVFLSVCQCFHSTSMH